MKESLKGKAFSKLMHRTRKKVHLLSTHFCFPTILESEHNQLHTYESSKIATNNYLDGVLAGFGWCCV